MLWTVAYHGLGVQHWGKSRMHGGYGLAAFLGLHG